MRTLMLALWALVLPAGTALAASPYAGQEQRQINPHFPDGLVNRCPEMEIML